SRRRHTRFSRDWSSDVCSSDLLSAEEYREAMQAEIRDVVERQHALGLDVLVHGEPERNDMVEYFGEQLQGFAFTAFGWVQSYGRSEERRVGTGCSCGVGRSVYS